MLPRDPCAGKGSDEQTLFRGLLGNLDVRLGDADFPTYFLLAAMRRLNVDGLFEQCGALKRGCDKSHALWCQR